MSHRDSVVDGDGVELLANTARLLDLARDELAEIFEMDMAGDKLREGIDDGNDWLAEVSISHSSGAPETACTGHVPAVCERYRDITCLSGACENTFGPGSDL